MLSRRVVRGWLFKRVVVEVADTGLYEATKRYDLHGPWRRATPDDLRRLEEQEANEAARLSSNKLFPRGMRVKATKRGFHYGAEAEVMFQEPLGGRIWVLRDGASSPSFYYADEIEQWPRRDFRLWLSRAADSPQGLLES